MDRAVGIVVAVLCMLVLVSMLPIGVYARQSELKVVEVVASNNDAFEKALRIAESRGKIVYVFPEIRSFAAYLPAKIIDKLRSISGVMVGEAIVVEALGEELPSNCNIHGTVLSWNLDIINVPTVHEEYNLNGSGVYIAVLDTGLEP